MRIAVDAMGGDHAPKEIVAGAILAAPEISGELILVGIEDQIRPLLPADCPSNVRVHHASETIDMVSAFELADIRVDFITN